MLLCFGCLNIQLVFLMLVSLFFSSGLTIDTDPEIETEGKLEDPDNSRCPPSVQWLDLSQSLAFDDLFGQYLAILWTLCSKALWLQLHAPKAGNTAGSIHLLGNQQAFKILHQIRQASEQSKKCLMFFFIVHLYFIIC